MPRFFKNDGGQKVKERHYREKLGREGSRGRDGKLARKKREVAT